MLKISLQLKLAILFHLFRSKLVPYQGLLFLGPRLMFKVSSLLCISATVLLEPDVNPKL